MTDGTSEIRLLSLWQPWASLIALGLKRYETRSWFTRYRGRLAIHAAKRPVRGGELAEISANSLGHLSWETISTIRYPLGAIVAVADQVDCLGMVTAPSFGEDGKGKICIDDQSPLEKAVGDWRPGRFAHKYENVVLLPQPIEYRGSQGLRRITDPEVLSALLNASQK